MKIYYPCLDSFRCTFILYRQPEPSLDSDGWLEKEGTINVPLLGVCDGYDMYRCGTDRDKRTYA